MKKKQLILYMTIFSLFSTILISTSLLIPAPSVVDPPIVRDDALAVLKLDEDSSAFYLDLFDIFDDTSGSENFTIWIGSDWDSKYDCKEFTVEILDNDSAKITPKPNKFCNRLIVLNDTNAVGSAEHNLTITIKPVDDPPVIEMVGNVKVTYLDLIKVFLYENEWYNATVLATDADGDNLVFFDNSSLFDINYLTGIISFLPGPNDVGKSVVNITVSDINGSKYEDWINIEFTILNVNNPPSKTVIINPDNGSIHYPYSYIEFAGKSYDPDIMYGDYLTYNWYSDRDGELGSGEEIEVNYLSEGKHVITLNVTDSEGKYDTDSIILKVEDNYYRYDKYYLDLYLEQDYLIIHKVMKELVKALFITMVRPRPMCQSNIRITWISILILTLSLIIQPYFVIIQDQLMLQFQFQMIQRSVFINWLFGLCLRLIQMMTMMIKIKMMAMVITNTMAKTLWL